MILKFIDLLAEKWLDWRNDIGRDGRRSAHISRKWKMPKPPDVTCPACGEPPGKAIAVDTGDGWLLCWDCKNNDGELSDHYIDAWPFIEETANGGDFEAAGFEVV